jgi:hypothetical protein
LRIFAGVFCFPDRSWNAKYKKIKRNIYVETLLQQLEETLLNHGRPVQVAFHLYEILSEAGYSDELILETAEALADIVE